MVVRGAVLLHPSSISERKIKYRVFIFFSVRLVADNNRAEWCRADEMRIQAEADARHPLQRNSWAASSQSERELNKEVELNIICHVSVPGGGR